MDFPQAVRSRAFVAVAIISLSHAAGAQELRGTVTDSATRLPIPGAVLLLLDSAGATLARNITNQRGEYRIAASPRMRRMQVLRLGFRPRVVPLPRETGAVLQRDVHLVAIPTLLEAVRVTASARCARRPDRESAVSLLEQARAGLLTAVVAREANPASMTILGFQRTMFGISNEIERQSVRMRSSDRASTSFEAARSAMEFVRSGFARDSGGMRTYFGPDADVMLDEGFAAGYCFHISDPVLERTNQIGLAFVPADRRRGRVDLDGTLWIDTVARALRDIEFRFLGLPLGTEAARSGGRVSFWEMANGVVLIDRWFFRVPAATFDTTFSGDDMRVTRSWYRASELGGEVATATWPDGHSYQAPLGILNARAVDRDGRPVTGVLVRLMDTDYVASPDSLGFFEIVNLLPGPYVAAVVLPELAPLGITLPTSFRFVAGRDSLVRGRMLVPRADEYARRDCSGDSLTAEDVPWLVARVVTPDRKPVKSARWQLSKDNGVAWQRVTESRTTGADGRMYYCMLLGRDDVVEVRAWREGEPPQVNVAKISRKGTTVTITLPPRP